MKTFLYIHVSQCSLSISSPISVNQCSFGHFISHLCQPAFFEHLISQLCQPQCYLSISSPISVSQRSLSVSSPISVNQCYLSTSSPISVNHSVLCISSIQKPVTSLSPAVCTGGNLDDHSVFGHLISMYVCLGRERTNRITTASLGISYLCTFVWTERGPTG